MSTKSEASDKVAASLLSASVMDPARAVREAVVIGTATLAQYARRAHEVVPLMRKLALQQVMATEARERSALVRRPYPGWTSVTLHRLAAYPPGCQLPAEVTLAVEEAVEIALSVPPSSGVMPDQARLREQCAITILVLGDTTGDLLRRRIWAYTDDAWHFASDLVLAAQRSGLPAADADDFMGVPPGYFQERINDGHIALTEVPDRSAELVTYYQMAKCTRPPDSVCEGQIWSQ
jgi:hypothetical protein